MRQTLDRTGNTIAQGRAEGKRIVNIVRTLGVFMALAALSFVLGFFVLARLLPGSSKPAMASTPPAASPEHDSPVAEAAPVARQKPIVEAAPRPAAPGPTLDAETDAVPGARAAHVQKPRRIADAGLHAHTSPDSTGDMAANASDSGDSTTPDAAPAVEKPRRRRRVAVTTENADTSPAADDTNADGSTASGDDPETPAPRARRTRRTSATSDDEQDSSSGPTADTLRSTRHRSSEVPAEAAPVYHVQLGQFHTRDAANREVRRAHTRGFDTQVVPIVRRGRTLYRVQAGVFRERSRAETVKESLQGASLDASVSEQKR